jgi:hypothetical protein
MKLAGPFKIEITGDPAAFIACPRNQNIAVHNLLRLFNGEEVAVDELESWGLKVTLVDEFISIPRLED